MRRKRYSKDRKVTKKYKYGVVSGYFDPIHSGHLDYLKAAKENCEFLIVIVNSDQQAKLKKGKSFMNERERSLIVHDLAYVDFVVVDTLDNDGSVCEMLKHLKEKYPGTMLFMNGGDRTADNIPELDIPGIDFMFNVGGKKTNSSSIILKNYFNT